MSALNSPNYPPHIHLSQTPIPLIHCQGNIHAAPHHSTSFSATWGEFPLCFAKYLLPALTLFFLCYCCYPYRLSHHLKSLTLSMDYWWSLFGNKNTIDISIIIVPIIVLVLVNTYLLFKADTNSGVFNDNIYSKTKEKEVFLLQGNNRIVGHC